MAYIEKTKGGKRRAHVDKNGVRESQTFDTVQEAKNWAAVREAEIIAVGRGQFPRRTLGEVLTEYGERFSPAKEGGDKELMRFAALARDFPWLYGKQITEASTADWARWRDARLKVVTGSTVHRDINLYSAVYHKAMYELGPYVKASPFTHLEKPRENPSRTRRWPWRETKFVLRLLGYKTGQRPETKAQEIAYAILVCLRTTMRIGETLSLADENVDLRTRVVEVGHKMQYITGKVKRVPVEYQAVRLFQVLAGRGRYFTMSPKQVDGLWRKLRDRALIEDLHIHDTRGEAITRLARKVDALTLSKISGIKDLKLLKERYYRETEEDIAVRMRRLPARLEPKHVAPAPAHRLLADPGDRLGEVGPLGQLVGDVGALEPEDRRNLLGAQLGVEV